MKVVLAYSGGLDTSVILAWLQERKNADVIAYTADLGQGEEVAEARDKALSTGAVEALVEDLRSEFVTNAAFPALRAAALYEGYYLLGTALARPIITKGLVAAADHYGADAIAHGATGKGNDQVRFELSAAALAPHLEVIAPWREWDLVGRADCIAYAEQRGIPVPVTLQTPYSTDANLWHVSYEGGILEDPWLAPPATMYRVTVDPASAPDDPEEVVIGYQAGVPVSINGAAMDPVTLVATANELGGRHGVGRVDMVENRFVGLKSRGVYETPGGTLLFHGLRAVESVTLDGEAAHLRNQLAHRYAEMVYNGFWFAPERLALQALVDEVSSVATGEARLSLYKGSVSITGRRSESRSYDRSQSSFDEAGGFDQGDAAGFIALNSLRLRRWGSTTE